MLKSVRLTTPWAIVIGAVIVAAANYFGPATDRPMLVAVWIGSIATVFLAVIAVPSVRSANRIEWFTGAMERHSDQQRQIAAHKAGIKMIWWDPSQSPGPGKFPFDGAHDTANDLAKIYVGVPLEYRKVQPSLWKRFWSKL